MKLKHLSVPYLILLGAVALGEHLSANNQSIQHVSSSMVQVIDGDTVRIGGDRYRLLGFDTPETRFAKCASELDLGNRATQRLAQLIRAEQIVTLHVNSRRDRYDRFLARLEVGGQDVGPVLMSEGLARAYQGGQRMGWC